MKVAVILCGNIRTWERSNLLDFIDMDVDYFISTTNKKYNYHPFISSKYGYNDINDDLISNDEIKNLFKFNYKSLVISDDDIIDESKLSENMRNIDSCYHQFNRIKKALDLVENYEIENNIKYDFIVKTRFDMKYHYKLSNYLNDTNYVITSIGETIIISKRDDFFNIINFSVNEFYKKTDINSHLNPPHGLFLSSININNLVYKEISIADIDRL